MQAFYFTEKHRAQLLREFGVESWRILQRPGMAVFVPAGCPHQVGPLPPLVRMSASSSLMTSPAPLGTGS